MVGRVWTRIVLQAMLVAAVAAAPCGSAGALAQVRLNRVLPARSSAVPAANENVENVFLPPDRAVLQQLAKAKELLEEGRYGDAVRFLGVILDNTEDFFFQPEKDAPIHRSLKAEAQRLIGSMPKKGLDLYQLRFGIQAKRLFDEAILDGDAERLAEVSRRFFHTEAGYEATLLLGLDHLHHARPLAAALTLQRLREQSRAADRFEPTLSLAAATAFHKAGMPEKARELLCALKDQQENRPVSVGGKPLTLFTKKNDAIDWLAGIVGSERSTEEEASRWAMFRGSPSRNAAANGGAPLLNMRWQIPVSDDPLIEEMIRQQRQQALDGDSPVLPGLHPLVVDDVVLMRTMRNLMAVDFATGKRLWEVPVDDPLENLGGKTPNDLLFRQQPQLVDGITMRVRGDATYGTLSSDGRLVFSIEDLGFLGTPTVRRNVIIAGQPIQNQGLTACNRLAAHDIRTGKLKWHVGGPADQYALRLPETFFLGPPLPLLGQLYVLAESKGEGAIVLMALDAKNGDLLWSQPLAVVEQSILEDPLRRVSGVSPSYADGVLVCPTSVGAVVAVELATRSLLWGYRYSRSDSRSPMAMMRVIAPYNAPATGLWSDGPAVLADGRVLLTPLESDALHCLNLFDGKLLWSYTKQDDLYLACVEDDQAVLVGRRGVKALRLSDGKAAWEGRIATFPEGTSPTGRGFLSKNQYFVPLGNASVMSVNLKTGEAAHVAVSRKGNVPGNLVCYKGRVVSQGLDGIEAFYQVDSVRNEVNRRLAANADDAGALSLQGEILLDEGKRVEAVACFQQAYAADPDPRTRGLLRDAMLEGLKSDFAASRSQVPQIEILLDDNVQRAGFLRLLAQGLQSAGEPAAAFEQYVRLIDLDSSGRMLENISPGLNVRRDRWLRMQIASVLEEAKDPAVRADIDSRIATRFEKAMQASDDEPLRIFSAYFGGLPAAVAARQELFRRYSQSGRVLEAEMLLWTDWQSADGLVAGPATARLTDLMQKAGRDHDAAACYAQLAGKYAQVACLDGQTGKQLYDALPAGSVLRGESSASDAWPTGLVEVSYPKLKGPRQPSYGRYGVTYDGSPAPFFSDVSVVYDQNQRSILARDGFGADMWKLTLNDRQQQNIFFHRTMTDGAVQGHLLLMSLGWKIMAIDTAGSATNHGAKLLWDIDMTSSAGDGASHAMPMQFGMAFGNMPNALQQAQFYRMNVRMSGVGPTNHEVFCFQRFRTLVAVDPLTGETLWTAANVPAGSELFGDTQYIFALPPNETEAIVFRAADGQSLGKRKLPRNPTGNNNQMAPTQNGAAKYQPLSQDCIATFGRQTLLWRMHNGRRQLELFDPWEQKDAFPAMDFAANSVISLMDREAIGICEPGGRFVLVSLPDGRKIVDAKLPVEEKIASLQQITVERFGDLYLLIVGLPPKRDTKPARNIQPLPGLATQPIMHGWAFAFRADGKPAWANPAPIDNQHLLPNQPTQVPLLVFACQEYIQLKNNAAKNQILIKCLDKRTGQTVRIPPDSPDKTPPDGADKTPPDGTARFEGTTAAFEVVGDPKEKKIELRMQQRTVCLTFTDKPIPPEEPKPEAAADKPRSGVAEAILRAFGRAAEQSVPPSFSEDLFDVDPDAVEAFRPGETTDVPEMPEVQEPNVEEDP